MSNEHVLEVSFSVADMVANAPAGTFDSTAGPGEPCCLGNRWHYHFFEPAWDARFMRCIVPGCEMVKPTCQHEYQAYGPAFHYCRCGDVRRVPYADAYGVLFRDADTLLAIEGDA